MIIDIVKTILVRSIAVGECAYVIAFMVCIKKNSGYYAYLVTIAIIVVDTVYICVRRKGRDYTW